MTEAAATTDTGTQSAGTQAITSANGAGDPASWTSTIPENARDYVANKGWKSPTDLLTSYQKLESTLGTKRLALPKEGDAASEAEWRKEIGVPESADKYEVKLPEGAQVDEGFLKVAKAWFHEAGLTPKQANALAAKYAEYGANGQKESAEAWNKQSEAELEGVKKEWGKEADANFAAAQRALRAGAKAAGLDPVKASEAMEQALGTAAYSKLMAFFGGMTGEHRFVEGSGTVGSHFTPEAARARMDQLKRDPGWFQKFQANDTAAVNEWKQLLAAAASGLS